MRVTDLPPGTGATLFPMLAARRLLSRRSNTLDPLSTPFKSEPYTVCSCYRDTCELHFNREPIKIVSSRGQYLIGDDGFEYLDCASRTSNVGHCHPRVVRAATSQMSVFNTCIEDVVTCMPLEREYSKKLLATLPSNFDVCLFTNSGAEANDLALQLVRSYTQKKGVVVVDGSFHGSVDLLIDISPSAFKRMPTGKKPWVHVVPCPDMYRGPYSPNDPDAAEKHFQESKVVLDRVLARNGELGGLICEPVFVVHGVTIPPPGWLNKIYNYIHMHGGLVVADEIQTGMGRPGTHFWAFQTMGAIPDIITAGKPMGSGYPIAAVITSRRIANSLSAVYNNYHCSPVAAAMGLSVLDIIHSERLMNNAVVLGEQFMSLLKELRTRHIYIGDVRGLGLIIGVDIVCGRDSKKPSPELAEKISYRLKDQQVIVANEGESKNVLTFIPPLCLTLSDIANVITKLDKVLMELEVVQLNDIQGIFREAQPQPSSIFHDDDDDDDDEEMFQTCSRVSLVKCFYILLSFNHYSAQARQLLKPGLVLGAEHSPLSLCSTRLQ
uniref:Alanine-glyoxylate aminotransferase n=1 Tax=Timema bartmani TaxID=61472 RepID=A0A7R9F5D4_9NEOP|nr:unnamed protein product [Timema bartmani]